MGTLQINPELEAAGTKYRKEILSAPLMVFDDIVKHFTVVSGLQGRMVGGWMNVSAELRPYRTAKDATGEVSIAPEEMENYLGDLVQEFDPYIVYESLYQEPVAVQPTNMQIARRIAGEISRKVGEKLHDNLFIAKRNAVGNNTVDLFNGFETLLDNAETAGRLSGALGNLMDLTADAISEANAGDILKNAWRNLDRILKKEKVKLYIPEDLMDMYEDWYQNEYSTQPWNSGIEQKFLTGSRGRCELVPLNPMSGNYMIFTIPQNMKILVDGESDKETVRIRECDNPKLVQFFMKAYFGTGFETVQKEYMCAAKIALSI